MGQTASDREYIGSRMRPEGNSSACVRVNQPMREKYMSSDSAMRRAARWANGPDCFRSEVHRKQNAARGQLECMRTREPAHAGEVHVIRQRYEARRPLGEWARLL